MREGTVTGHIDGYTELIRELRGEPAVRMEGECWTGALDPDVGMRAGAPWRPSVRG